MRRVSRKDVNHDAVADAFRSMGCSVFELDRVGDGFPDLIVGLLGVSVLVEVKNLETHYGRQGLNRKQSAFAAAWRGGPVRVVCSEDEAIALVQNMRRGSR